MKSIKPIILLASCLVACKTVKHLPTEKITETRTEVVEVMRDTTVYVPADQATLQALLECDSSSKILVKEMEALQGKLNAKANIRIRDNIIFLECICDSTAIYLQLKDRFETTTTNKAEVRVVWKEKELRWWQKALMWVGGGLLLLVIPIMMVTRKK